MNKILTLFLSLVVLSFAITYLVRLFALRHKILDIPNDRSSHTIPTPRGGGLAIVISWYLGITVLFFYKYIDKDLYFALLSGILLAIISLIDDLFNLKPFIRLSVQFITALLAIVLLRGINSVALGAIELNSAFILYPIAIIGIVWFINLFNFLDGIDGYASLEAIFVAASFYLLSGSSIGLLLIACIVGFLIWNWPKAKIFMGDIGSTQLGFILIVLGIYFHNSAELSIINWLMLTSLFWFDATLTLFRRWINGEKLSIAHRKHAYQRAVQSGFSHLATILMSLGINIIIIGLVIVSRKYSSLIIPLFLINIIFLYGITMLIDKRVPFYNSAK